MSSVQPAVPSHETGEPHEASHSLCMSGSYRAASGRTGPRLGAPRMSLPPLLPPPGGGRHRRGSLGVGPAVLFSSSLRGSLCATRGGNVTRTRPAGLRGTGGRSAGRDGRAVNPWTGGCRCLLVLLPGSAPVLSQGCDLPGAVGKGAGKPGVGGEATR